MRGSAWLSPHPRPRSPRNLLARIPPESNGGWGSLAVKAVFTGGLAVITPAAPPLRPVHAVQRHREIFVGSDPLDFFPEDYEANSRERITRETRALQTCARCLVQTECFEWAMSFREAAWIGDELCWDRPREAVHLPDCLPETERGAPVPV
ncbi:MAG: WhiB family transcriptional regulator, partial [Actinomycetota bacterium]